MPTISGTRHYNVRVHQSITAEVTDSDLAANAGRWFDEDGQPTADLDQYMCDNGTFSNEEIEVCDDDQLNYEYAPDVTSAGTCPAQCPTSREAWARVRAALETATSMHWDGCHKIYLAMDPGQTHQFEQSAFHNHTPDLDMVRCWFGDSCALRFVSAVRSIEGSTEAAFTDLIAQFDLDDDPGHT